MTATCIGLVGFGHWGTRLARAIQAEPECRLAGIVDIDTGRRAAARAAHDGIAVHATIDELAGIDALAIAVYPASQPNFVRAGLARGLHVLAEKPLAVSAAEAGTLADLAGRSDRVLLVDCTPVYSPLTEAVCASLAGGAIGAPTRYRARRAHGGRRQPGIDVLLDLAVHDLAVLDASLAVSPVSVAATGVGTADAGPGLSHMAQIRAAAPPVIPSAAMDPGAAPGSLAALGITDGSGTGRIVEARIELHCAGGLQAIIDVSWTGDDAVRQTVIDGTHGILRRDDRAVTITLERRVTGDATSGARWLDLPDRDDEPLRRLVRHFSDCITHGTQPRTDARAASRHIGWLEAAARSIAAAGRTIDLSTGDCL